MAKLTQEGYLNITVVDGTSRTGYYTADGSVNIVNATGESGHVGVYHPCGAINITVVDGTSHVGRYASNGSLNVIEGTEAGFNHPCVDGTVDP